MLWRSGDVPPDVFAFLDQRAHAGVLEKLAVLEWQIKDQLTNFMTSYYKLLRKHAEIF